MLHALLEGNLRVFLEFKGSCRLGPNKNLFSFRKNSRVRTGTILQHWSSWTETLWRKTEYWWSRWASTITMRRLKHFQMSLDPGSSTHASRKVGFASSRVPPLAEGRITFLDWHDRASRLSAFYTSWLISSIKLTLKVTVSYACHHRPAKLENRHPENINSSLPIWENLYAWFGRWNWTGMPWRVRVLQVIVTRICRSEDGLNCTWAISRDSVKVSVMSDVKAERSCNCVLLIRHLIDACPSDYTYPVQIR